MATEESVIEHFQLLGIDVDGPALCKCVNLCVDYGLDPEAFVEQWMAFSLSHLQGAAPTLDTLELLERKELVVKEADFAGSCKDVRGSKGPSVPNYNDCGPDDDVLSDYLATTPKRVRHSERNFVEEAVLSPVTSSPSLSQSDKNGSKTNTGAVLLSFGTKEALEGIEQPGDKNDNLTVRQLPNEEGVLYRTKAMFGFELLQDKAATVDNHISYISQCIKRKANLGESSSVRCKSQVPVTVVGRIECDADARLNANSVLLQGTWQDSLGQSVPVQLDDVKQYSLFPGQVVAMRGLNPRGDRFLAQEIFTDASQPEQTASNAFKGSIKLMVASGPFTASDALSFGPLRALATRAARLRPHVLILAGPLLDADHPRLADNTLTDTYRTFIDKLLDSFVNEVSSASPHTQIVLMASCRDVFHVPVYPTPAFSCRHPSVTVLPDPATINVGGVIVGLTTTDVLMHLCQEEIAHGAHIGDKLSRLSWHVLSQQCYYPLCAARASLCVDAALWDAHAHMPTAPHLLLLPSNFRYFVKEVNGCVVVNPEHLTKGVGNGTFAQIQITVDDQTPLSAAAIACQIVRI